MPRLASASQLERLLTMHRLLQSGAGISVAEIARAQEVSIRTVYRDMDILRDTFGAPLSYVTRSRRWRYSASVTSLDDMLRLRERVVLT